jgi:hypothetical protein
MELVLHTTSISETLWSGPPSTFKCRYRMCFFNVYIYNIYIIYI